MFSETYIKMCEKAEEIQKVWHPKRGDFTYWKANIENPKLVLIYDIRDELLCTISFNEGTYHTLTKEKLIWLPRQGQLQDMLDEDYFYHAFILNEPNNILQSIYSDDGIHGSFESGEEYWLAFIMYKLYNKQWDADKQQWVRMEGNNEA